MGTQEILATIVTVVLLAPMVGAFAAGAIPAGGKMGFFVDCPECGFEVEIDPDQDEEVSCYGCTFTTNVEGWKDIHAEQMQED